MKRKLISLSILTFLALGTGLFCLNVNTNNEVVVCVPYVDLFYALNIAQGTNIKIGAQNMNAEEKGAYTGEVSRRNAKINWSRICNNRTL